MWKVLLKFWKIHFIVLTLNFFSVAPTEPTTKIVFLEVDCQKLSTKVATVNCFTEYKEKHSAVTIEVTYAQDINLVEAKAIGNVLQDNNRGMQIFDFKFEFCKFLEYGPRRSLMGIFYQRLREVSVNFPKKCPFKKNVTYAFKDFYLDVDMIPTYLPELNFSVNAEIYSGKETLLTYTAKGAVCKNKQIYCKKFF